MTVEKAGGYISELEFNKDGKPYENPDAASTE